MGKVIFPPFEHAQSGSLTAILIVGSEDWHVYSALRDVRLDQQESFLQLLPNCMRHNSIYNLIIASHATARTNWMRETPFCTLFLRLGTPGQTTINVVTK